VRIFLETERLLLRRFAVLALDLLAGPGDGDHGPGVDGHGASSVSGGAVG
jgi:hypothetical protein